MCKWGQEEHEIRKFSLEFIHHMSCDLNINLFICGCMERSPRRRSSARLVRLGTVSVRKEEDWEATQSGFLCPWRIFFHLLVEKAGTETGGSVIG